MLDPLIEIASRLERPFRVSIVGESGTGKSLVAVSLLLSSDLRGDRRDIVLCGKSGDGRTLLNQIAGVGLDRLYQLLRTGLTRLIEIPGATVGDVSKIVRYGDAGCYLIDSADQLRPQSLDQRLAFIFDAAYAARTSLIVVGADATEVPHARFDVSIVLTSPSPDQIADRPDANVLITDSAGSQHFALTVASRSLRWVKL